MVKLINGRGRLGSLLRTKLESLETTEELYIYHTWNVSDKSEDSQKKEFEKFKIFVNNNKDKKIILVSTSSQRETYYTFYKHLAESYLLLNSKSSLVIKLPLFISSNSVFTRLKNNEAEPFGEMEIISLEKAADSVINFMNYDGLNRVRSVKGDIISASYVKEILEL